MGSRVQGLWLWVEHLRFRVRGAGLTVQGGVAFEGLAAKGFKGSYGTGGSGFGLRVSGFGFRISSFGFWV